MARLALSPPLNGVVSGHVTLNGSKSISNRALIIRALSGHDFSLSKLSNAKDSQLMMSLLSNDCSIYDAGAAGTTFRFLTAYLSQHLGKHELTGSERMKQRPIGVLVEALRELGAEIAYLEKEGYPPLSITGKELKGGRLSIPANVSSQYISALLMIGPILEEGLELHLEGTIVSKPYILMTLNLMAHFGVKYRFDGNTIKIENGCYQSKDFTVEADWSAASYFYSFAALANESDLSLSHLDEKSLQGDAEIIEIAQLFGINSLYESPGKWKLDVDVTTHVNHIEYDFLACPDLAQTVIVCLAALNITGRFTGLETLAIKETDRVWALNKELTKIGWQLFENDEAWHLRPNENFVPSEEALVFDTYEDHRMAMCLAPLALKFGTIYFNDPDVVEKSYPNFWKDLEVLGFQLHLSE